MVCRSKAGLVNHRRRMHESQAKKTFECERCKQVFKKISETTKTATMKMATMMMMMMLMMMMMIMDDDDK